MNKLVAFVKDSYVEMREKVTWTKYSELQSHTTLVLVASIIFALVIGGVDVVFDRTLDLFYTSIFNI